MSSEATKPVTLPDSTARILVLSSTEQLAEDLKTALGPARLVGITPETDAARIPVALQNAEDGIVVVDATKPPPVQVAALAHMLSEVSTDSLTVWGSETTFGRLVSQTMHERGVRCVCLRSSEGIDPLLDVIGSRQP